MATVVSILGNFITVNREAEDGGSVVLAEGAESGLGNLGVEAWAALDVDVLIEVFEDDIKVLDVSISADIGCLLWNI